MALTLDTQFMQVAEQASTCYLGFPFPSFLTGGHIPSSHPQANPSVKLWILTFLSSLE